MARTMLLPGDRLVTMVTVAMTLVALTTALTELDGKMNNFAVTLCMRVLFSPLFFVSGAA